MVDKQALQQESIYHIRVKGTLDEKWADWFEGFVMESRGNGETLLTGAVVDQAALQGVLARIHSLGCLYCWWRRLAAHAPREIVPGVGSVTSVPPIMVPTGNCPTASGPRLGGTKNA
jgi:hypothetical protein